MNKNNSNKKIKSIEHTIRVCMNTINKRELIYIILTSIILLVYFINHKSLFQIILGVLITLFISALILSKFMMSLKIKKMLYIVSGSIIFIYSIVFFFILLIYFNDRFNNLIILSTLLLMSGIALSIFIFLKVYGIWEYETKKKPKK